MFDLTSVDTTLVQLFGPNVFAISGRVRDALIAEHSGAAIECKDFAFVITGHTLDQVRERLGSAGAHRCGGRLLCGP
ncbi:MAG: hypothetical protein DLM73_17730 [Chthoniobacterales bacterium]|nr:MAG: hypothetical protein DLM73_17730 [Chthoniobacterales bacterium]